MGDAYYSRPRLLYSSNSSDGHGNDTLTTNETIIMTTTAHPMPPPSIPSRTIYELSKEAHDGLHFSPRYALETWVPGANMKFPIG